MVQDKILLNIMVSGLRENGTVFMNEIIAFFAKFTDQVFPRDRNKITKQKKPNILCDFIIFQSEICTSSRSTDCKEIDSVSEELKSIYHSGEVRIAEDVDLTVNVIEKIVTNISPENVNKTPRVRKHFIESLN